MAFKITNRDTGEIQLVKATDGYDPAVWEFEQLGRAPRPYEELDPETGKLRDHRKIVEANAMPNCRDSLKELIREVLREENLI